MRCPLCLLPAPENGPCPACGFIPYAPEEAPEIPGYTVLGEIGRGGAGVVVLAVQESLERTVALKLLMRERMTPESEDAFFREAKVAARLAHPGIVSIIEAGRCADGSCFFAMELVRGKTVETLLQENGSIPVRKALKIALAVAEALDYGFSQFGMIHGDIKPSNLLIRDTDNLIKLADFGLARFGAEILSDELSATPLYAAPEVFREGQKGFSVRSDMYSFGIMLYELITGKAPFTGSVEELQDLHQNCDAPPLSAAVCGCDPDLDALITWLLGRDPAVRPENWTSVAECLKGILHRDERSDIPVARAYPRPRRKKGNRRLFRILLLLLLLGCLLGALWCCGRRAAADISLREAGFDTDSP